jgi:hypothetical protein
VTDYNYIGESKRKVKVRIGEHFKGEAITDHIKYCKVYKSKYKFFKKTTHEIVTVEQLRKGKMRQNLSNDELKLEYFKSHFKILQKGFRSKQHRLNAEAFFIRINRPKLNKQEELKFFQLF